MTIDRLAATAADKLLGTDQATGKKLIRTAVRPLARGAPITVAELAAAAGVEVDDLRNAPAGHDIDYDDQHRIVGWGLTLTLVGGLKSRTFAAERNHGLAQTLYQRERGLAEIGRKRRDGL